MPLDPPGTVEWELALVVCDKKVPVRGTPGTADGAESGIMELSLMIKVPGQAEHSGQGVLCAREVCCVECDMVVDTPVPEADGLCIE